MSMGGGGSGGGGMVVGGPAPWAANVAGQYQAAAAQAAMGAAQQQTNDAINLIRTQYNNAFMSLKPYTSEGIQALNELNSYMGLQAYNPGTAPTAPKKYTAEDLKDQITNSQIRSNIMMNTNIVQDGAGFSHATYYGPGADALKTAGGTTDAYFDNSGEFQFRGNTGQGYTPARFAGNGFLQDYTRMEMAADLAQQKNATYDTAMETYNQQMDLYNQAKTAYDNYQGPLTPEEVQAKLMAQPGVGFQYNQGLDAIQRAASAKGQIGSGRLLQSLSDYGQGMASQQYGATLQRLAGLVELGANAAGQQAQGSMNLGNITGQLTSNLGDTMANSYLAQGNAMSQALLAANQEYKVIGGNQGGGGGGLGGIGSLLSGIGSIAGSGLFGSSKELKDKVSTPSTQEILNAVKDLDVDVWKYRSTDRKHLGPYAEDFAEKFGVGDGKTINIIDMMGIMLASIKELGKQVETLQNELERK
jgi:hypothetical protein